MAKVSLKPFHLECSVTEAWEFDDTSTGFCTNCGAEHEGECEPDATNYLCEIC